jgi:cytochrome P450
LAGRAPRAEDLPQLVFCEAIMLEALRLYPPVWVFGREALTDVQLNGYTIKTGEELVVCAWLLHRDANIFPEPESFKPERWLGGARSKLPRCSYLPFSTGPRNCLGEHFAMMESILVLASVARNWQFRELPDRPDPGWSAQLLYWPRRGIRLRAEHRAAQ